MRIPLPSFRIQIILLVLFFLINSVLFYRNYFLDSFSNYSKQVTDLHMDDRITELYQKYSDNLSEQSKNDFRNDVEALLSTEKQSDLFRTLFRDELRLYSAFIFAFLSIAVLILFLFSFNLVTRPLMRLQSATDELSGGNWSIQVQESRFSPLNDLIVSFNRMTRELDDNRRKLIQAEKESAWREMARVLAHEIKNPLTPMRLSLERLERKYKNQSPDFAAIFSRVSEVLHEEINNLQELASEFSQFARLPKASLRRFNLAEQMEDIIEPYVTQAEINLHKNSDAPEFYGDRMQLKQVFVNLIQNAIQAGSTTINISCAIANNWRLIFTDNGKGIPEKNVGKIFEPYFTRREKGTGLGLAIVKRIVENHDGTIEVESTVGKGTTFTLTFPLIQDGGP